MRGSGTAVVLHLKAQMTHSDPPQHHAAWLDLPIFLQTQGGTHRFVGRLLSVILWIGLAEIRNFRINHAESARKKAKALDTSFGPHTNPANGVGTAQACLCVVFW